MRHTIVGLDLGTTKICTVVAQVHERGGAHILGVGTAPSKGFEKGVVVHIDDAAAAIASSIEQAEKQSGVRIDSAYVGVTGSHISSLNSSGAVAIGRSSQEITEDDIARAAHAAEAVIAPSQREVLHVIPRTYTVDDQEGVRNPIGMRGYRLEVQAHLVSGEAMAILAGDGLLTYSFQILTEKTPPLTNDKRVRLIYELAKAAGPMGMVAGQALDITGESRSITIKELEHVHANKTGKLLAFSVKAGAILGDAEPAIIEKLEEFAFHLGLAFQIRDDILDVEGSSEIMGKSAGIDANNKKTTYPSLLSVSVAKEKLSEHIKKAKEILHSLPLDTNHLEFLTDLVEKRDR